MGDALMGNSPRSGKSLLIPPASFHLDHNT
jgi:hypothetical protein